MSRTSSVFVHSFRINDCLQAIYRMRGDFNKVKAEDASEQLFCHLDKNRDNELSEQEFITGAKSSKAIMDILGSH